MELNARVGCGRLLVFWIHGTTFGRCVNSYEPACDCSHRGLVAGDTSHVNRGQPYGSLAWDSFKFPLYALLLGVLTYSLLQLLVYGWNILAYAWNIGSTHRSRASEWTREGGLAF
jgi:hypothetical protein